ncbi:HK97 family phage prohead protease [Roseicyclus sp. F158]|uniref:HK97 family phage prohead protease n=1 Tax=Tropicimonas omnivorans TaxID=3075590 RepID=A0ABU3DIU3_9RHOB|nr:HK97 family phage prohead protease [Roseicyclus sp. F158]MDT0683612.1 HK97 family phage prohead protease [Roseicyclus sp. F158]
MEADDGTDGIALERKFCAVGDRPVIGEGLRISGYASLFGRQDRGGDRVAEGAFAKGLAALERSGRRVKMLWQHDPAQPIGVWEMVREDATGLLVQGRLLPDVARAREAAALLSAGAIEGLSIGYRTTRAERDADGVRVLREIDLWEVSLVTFPMQIEARIAAAAGADTLKTGRSAPERGNELARAFETARRRLAAINGA